MKKKCKLPLKGRDVVLAGGKMVCTSCHGKGCNTCSGAGLLDLKKGMVQLRKKYSFMHEQAKVRAMWENYDNGKEC